MRNRLGKRAQEYWTAPVGQVTAGGSATHALDHHVLAHHLAGGPDRGDVRVPVGALLAAAAAAGVVAEVDAVLVAGAVGDADEARPIPVMRRRGVVGPLGGEREAAPLRGYGGALLHGERDGDVLRRGGLVV